MKTITGRWLKIIRLPFVPAIAVMNRLGFARKFILIALLLAWPLATVAYLQFTGANEHIEFTKKERDGVVCLRATAALLDVTQRHRLLASTLVEGTGDTRSDLNQSVASAGDALERACGAGSWQNVRERWSRVQASPQGPESQSAYDALSRTLLDSLLALGGESNLILDPGPDTYWLVDALLVKIPALSETVARDSAAAIMPVAAGEHADRRAAAIAGRQEFVHALAQDLAGLIMRATARDASPSRQRAMLDASIGELLRKTVAAVEQHARLLEHQGFADTAMASPEEIRRGTEATLQRLHELSERIAPELELLLARRAQRFEAQRTLGLSAAGGVAILLAYLFIAIYLSMRQSLQEIEMAAALEPGTPERFVAPGQDEFGQLAAAYGRARGEQLALREQLRLADKLATIGQLAAGTAHELNEPLGIILGRAQLAQKRPGLPDAAATDLVKVVKATIHAREIIKQLLLFARRAPLKKAPVDLNQVTVEGLEFLDTRCQESGISIVRDLANGLPGVEADVNQLRQVVLNLIVNALQATPRGGEVKVTTQGADGAVVLAIEDHGCGMDEEVRKHLFLPFYTTKDIGQGTGLGLSVVHGIVTAHEGTIQVDSAPGRGTRIEVRLPAPGKH